MKIVIMHIFYPVWGRKKTMTLFLNTKVKFIKEYCRKKLSEKYGVSIGRRAEIDRTVDFPHPQNIVIGNGVIIEKNVTIYQGVTVGIKNPKDYNPHENQTHLYPTIKKNTTVYANSVIFGNIEIGKNSIVGAGSIVNKTFPSNVIIGGNPGKIIGKKEVK